MSAEKSPKQSLTRWNDTIGNLEEIPIPTPRYDRPAFTSEDLKIVLWWAGGTVAVCGALAYEITRFLRPQ